jgi:hypothetical protein
MLNTLRKFHDVEHVEAQMAQVVVHRVRQLFGRDRREP